MRKLDRRLSSESGQSLILAVIVMFLLVFLGIMFILVISRNLTRAARSTDVTEATALAEAGIRFADRMLTTSEEGADWRPAPDNMGWVNSGGTWTWTGASGDDLRANHPDFKWLRPYWPVEEGNRGPTGGFTSFKSGSGRFLLRVSYDPNPDDPLSKHIKIESIGRIGYVDVDDPTTWGPASKIKLRRELTAYKPIGITDYLFFVTNKEKKNTPIGLGCPGYTLQLGRPESDPEPFYGAPVRVNGDLTWHGNEVSIYLRGKTVPPDPDNPTGASTYLPIDTVEVAGEISHDMDATGNNPIGVTLWESIDGNPPTSFPVYPSRKLNGGAPDFTTANGFYRDGDEGTDANQFSRNVKRLEPPLLDEENPSTKLTRYKLLTLHSGTWREVNGDRFNTGRIGWGKGIYIDNNRDRQEESSSLFGGFSLRSDWTKPNNDMSSNWKGPYYVPPGVVITLNPEDTDGDEQPDLTITRTDTSRRNSKVVWRDYDNNPRADWGQTITMPYPTPNRRIVNPSDPDETIALPGNGVLYAEGNIRIKGMLPPGVQLTVVSNGTIYIEGNILKNRKTDNNGNIITDPTSAISLLARDYICVNTTQFMGLLSELGPMSIGSDAMNGEPPYHVIVTPEPGSNFRSTFVFGPPDGWDGLSVNPRIFVRHAGQYGPAYINMWINKHLGGGYPTDTGLYPFTSVMGDVPFYGVGDSGFNNAPGSGLTTLFRCDVWELIGGANLPTINWNIGYPNYLEIGIDPHPFQSLPVYVPAVPELRNYLLSAFAIQPMDIRIEAVMYAQEKSFFVIPGPWFNPDPEDVPGSVSSDQKRNNKLVDPRFPYFGQGLDIKVTVFGAVSMNLPASTADTNEWMSKWGYIPEKYGSSNVSTAHPGQGLTFLYDPMVGWPTYFDSGEKKYLRQDAYGRPLPATPRLPVCTSLIYFGDAP